MQVDFQSVKENDEVWLSRNDKDGYICRVRRVPGRMFDDLRIGSKKKQSVIAKSQKMSKGIGMALVTKSLQVKLLVREPGWMKTISRLFSGTLPNRSNGKGPRWEHCKNQRASVEWFLVLETGPRGWLK